MVARSNEQSLRYRRRRLILRGRNDHRGRCATVASRRRQLVHIQRERAQARLERIKIERDKVIEQWAKERAGLQDWISLDDLARRWVSNVPIGAGKIPPSLADAYDVLRPGEKRPRERLGVSFE